METNSEYLREKYPGYDDLETIATLATLAAALEEEGAD
jgi:hypothetical protein